MRREPLPRGESPPSGANANPPSATSPEPGARRARPRTHPRRAPTSASATCANRSAPAASSALTEPSAASAHPLAVGLLERRTTARRDGATRPRPRSGRPHGSTRAVTLTSTGRPVARARWSAASIRRSEPPRAAGVEPAPPRRTPDARTVTPAPYPSTLSEPALPRYVSLRPRAIAISPVRAISISPNGRTSASNASTLSQVPVTSTTIARLVTSTTFAAEDLADLHDLGAARSVGGDLEHRELSGERLSRAPDRGS